MFYGCFFVFVFVFCFFFRPPKLWDNRSWERLNGFSWNFHQTIGGNVGLVWNVVPPLGESRAAAWRMLMLCVIYDDSRNHQRAPPAVALYNNERANWCNLVSQVLSQDLEVIIDSKLSFEDHITEKVNKAYAILGIIKRNFDHIGKDAFVLLYNSRGGSRGGGWEGCIPPPPAHGGFFSPYEILPIASLFNATSNE